MISVKDCGYDMLEIFPLFHESMVYRSPQIEQSSMSNYSFAYQSAITHCIVQRFEFAYLGAYPSLDSC